MPVLQHELRCYTKKPLTAISVLDILRKMFLQETKNLGQY